MWGGGGGGLVMKNESGWPSLVFIEAKGKLGKRLKQSRWIGGNHHIEIFQKIYNCEVSCN